LELEKMNWLLNLVVVIQVLSALTMIGLVLVQHGKGADMGASFGSGASGSLFGATGSANFLSRSTAACAAVFFACTLGLAYIANDRTRTSAGSVLDRPAVAAPVAAPASGAAQIPGAPAVAASAVMVPAVPAPAAAPASGAAAIPSK
jgi:preprotein translocase subunit SecG